MDLVPNSAVAARKRRPISKRRYVEHGLDLNAILLPVGYSGQKLISGDLPPRRVLRSQSRARLMISSNGDGRQQANSTPTQDSSRRRHLSPSPPRRGRGRSRKRSRAGQESSVSFYRNPTQAETPPTKRRYISPSPEPSTTRRVLRSTSRARAYAVTVKSEKTSPEQEKRKSLVDSKTGQPLQQVRIGTQPRPVGNQNEDVEQFLSQVLQNQRGKAFTQSYSYVDKSVARRVRPTTATFVPVCNDNYTETIKVADLSPAEEEVGMAVNMEVATDNATGSNRAIITGTETSSGPLSTSTSTDEDDYHDTLFDNSDYPFIDESGRSPPKRKRWGSRCVVV